MNAMKCDICGRFVSYADLYSGKAQTHTTVEGTGGGDIREYFECYHVACLRLEKHDQSDDTGVSNES